MPRYHFDLVDHRTVEDQGGRILVDDITACDVADRLAAELHEIRPDVRGAGFSILVTGPEGETVHKAAVDGPSVAPSTRSN
jgi:hypothetical protein